MVEVRAEFVIDDIRNNVFQPHDKTWGVYADPADPEYALFTASDPAGRIELRTDGCGSCRVSVFGEISDQLLSTPGPSNAEHQRCVIEFYRRAFKALNHFIGSYRVRVLDHQVYPIKWEARHCRRVAGSEYYEFHLQPPTRLYRVEWHVNGEVVDLSSRVGIDVKSQQGYGAVSIPYSGQVLHEISNDFRDAVYGTPSSITPRETAYELILHAQELVTLESKERLGMRPAVLMAALITTAAACEVYVRGFIRAHGSSFHKFLVKHKDRAFSVRELLDVVVRDIPTVGESLAEVNPELENGLNLLFNARNRSAHKGQPSMILQREANMPDERDKGLMRVKKVEVEVPIGARMIHNPGYEPDDVDEDEVPPFSADVLAVIGWLDFKVGGRFANLDAAKHWDEQQKLRKGTRVAKLFNWYCS